jgi:hypothetical protein
MSNNQIDVNKLNQEYEEEIRQNIISNKTVKISLTQTEVSLARNLILYFIDDIADQEINQYSKSEQIAYETLKSKLYKAEKELGENK